MKVINARGLLALPSFINAHAHLDKSWWGKPWVPYAGEPTTQGRIAHERAHRKELGIPSVQTTTHVLRQMLLHGTTGFRTHVDVDLDVGLDGIEVVRESVAGFGDAIEVQIVAFPQDGVLRRPGVVDLLDRAAVEGADYIGGLDPASIDRDPVGQLNALFAIADRREVGLDIHLHDGGELGAFQIELILERTHALGLRGKVNIAHGFALGDIPAGRQRELIEAMRNAGVSLTTVAPLTVAQLPLTDLISGEVSVGLGTDGIRDLWGPFGDGDLLSGATRLAELAGWRHDDQLRAALHIATSGGAEFVGRSVHDLAVGARADLVLVDAENVEEAVVAAPPREFVLAGGHLVVDRGELMI
jgi:cytosine deaminase